MSPAPEDDDDMQALEKAQGTKQQINKSNGTLAQPFENGLYSPPGSPPSSAAVVAQIITAYPLDEAATLDVATELDSMPDTWNANIGNEDAPTDAISPQVPLGPAHLLSAVIALGPSPGSFNADTMYVTDGTLFPAPAPYEVPNSASPHAGATEACQADIGDHTSGDESGDSIAAPGSSSNLTGTTQTSSSTEGDESGTSNGQSAPPALEAGNADGPWESFAETAATFNQTSAQMGLPFQATAGATSFSFDMPGIADGSPLLEYPIDGTAQAFLAGMTAHLNTFTPIFPTVTGPVMVGPPVIVGPHGLPFTTPISEAMALFAGNPIFDDHGLGFQAAAFVDTLEQVDILSISAEDMKCPHCWLPFGTTDEDDPGFCWAPDPEHLPEISARLVAFRELPFCEGRANNDPVRTPCGHIYGRSCLIDAMEQIDTLCPLCRQEMCPDSDTETDEERYTSGDSDEYDDSSGGEDQIGA